VLHAIDFEGLTAAVGGSTPPGLISVGLLGGGAVEPIPYDLARAKELLAEAGYPNGVTLDLHYGNIVQFGVDFNVVAQKLQADLSEIGITLNIIPEEFTVWITAFRAGESPIAFSYNTPDYADPHSVTQVFGLSDGVFAKRMHYANPEVEKLVMDAVQTADPDVRTQLYAELQQKLNEDGNFHPLVQPLEVIGYRDNIVGFQLNPVNKINVFEIDKK
jgi:peptide/nickel transport system substrate-binding protein